MTACGWNAGGFPQSFYCIIKTLLAAFSCYMKLCIELYYGSHTCMYALQ